MNTLSSLLYYILGRQKEGTINIDTSATSGDDYDLTQSLTSLGWLTDVVTSGVLGGKKLLHKMLGMFTPQVYTDYHYHAYTQTDASRASVVIVGKLCIFSLSMTYTSDYTPSATQMFIGNMPKPLAPVIMQGITYSRVTSDASSYRPFRFRIDADGEIQNWHSGIKTYANQPTVFSGVYVIK